MMTPEEYADAVRAAHDRAAAHEESQRRQKALQDAAPKLLKLAEALVQSWEACADGAQAVRHNDGTVINVRALIAEAKGES